MAAMNLAEAIEVNARARPDDVALIAGPTERTYAHLATDVRAMAGRLALAGIARGAVVGVCLRDSADHLVANYALARMGAIILPMDWRWAEDERSRIAGHFRADLVLVEPNQPLPGAARAVPVADLPEAGAADMPPVANGADLPLLLSLSSGTTGRPKGPLITHGQMLRRFWTHWINLGLNANDRYVSATPLYFGGGRTFAMSVLFAGGTAVLFPPPFEADALCAELERVGATATFLVPTQLRKLLACGDNRLAPARRMRLLIASGAPLTNDERAEIETRLCANFVEYYASTEGGGISIATPTTRATRPASVGRPVFGVCVEVVDADHTPLPPGAVGRLRYRGPGVAAGYHRDAQASGEAFREGWFYPGDLAEIDESGYITLRGRAKDIIIRGGVNIYPDEIETVLGSHPAVAEAAVFGRPSQRLGEEVVAFIAPSGTLDAETLEAWCGERLAPYKVPATFIFTDALPRNSAGKVLKARLAERAADATEPASRPGRAT